jgi:predicted ABC-type ATPase
LGFWAKGRPLKDIIIIGGPNGAGKTSSAPAILQRRLDILQFVNADEIARGLSPFDPESTEIAAGRLMLERIQALCATARASPLKRRVPDARTRIGFGNVSWTAGA